MSKLEDAIKLAKIVSFLEEHNIEYAVINKDFTVDVDSNVDISREQLTEIPIQFGKVDGKFDCSNNNLVNLKGAPKTVYGNFECMNNELITLEGGPEYVSGYFSCSHNKITSLKKIGRVDGFIYSDFFRGKLEDYRGEL